MPRRPARAAGRGRAPRGRLTDPGLLRGAFRIAVLIFGLAAILVIAEPPGSAEFVVSLLSLFVGLAFVAVVAVLARHGQRRPPDDKRPGKTDSSAESQGGMDD